MASPPPLVPPLPHRDAPSVGFLNFPLKSTLSAWTGYVVLAWGVITVLAYMSRPEWFEVPKPAQTVAA